MEVQQWMADQPAYATATVAPDGANATAVAIVVRNVNGKGMGGGYFYLFLSDSPLGVGLTALTASGSVAIKAGTGNFIDLTTKKVMVAQPSIAGPPPGNFVLSITDTAKSPFRVCIQIGGVTQVLATLTAANYG